jgi:hypothetical protein
MPCVAVRTAAATKASGSPTRTVQLNTGEADAATAMVNLSDIDGQPVGLVIDQPLSHPTIDPPMGRMRSITPKHARVLSAEESPVRLELSHLIRASALPNAVISRVQNGTWRY